MGEGHHTHTLSGDLRTVDRRDMPVYRVGHRPDPWDWTPWEYAGTDGRFHGRWDDPTGTWRTTYAGHSALACFLEVLAVFRADPSLAEELEAIDDNADDDDRYPTNSGGSVPRSWCAARLIVRGRLTGTFALPGHAESLPTLRARFLKHARDLGLVDLDAAAIRDSRPRALSQAISAWLYTLSPSPPNQSTTTTLISTKQCVCTGCPGRTDELTITDTAGSSGRPSGRLQVRVAARKA